MSKELYYYTLIGLSMLATTCGDLDGAAIFLTGAILYRSIKEIGE